ncbi:MAG: MarR family winged helix-turn-helix transcriptional regulator [Marmoricola sp.]
MIEQSGAPQDSTTTRLYLAVGRLNRALRRDARDATIGHGGLSALATLIEQGPQRAGALAEIEGITAPAMTRIVNSLVELGYVERTPDPADGRAQLVAATAAGTDLVQHKRAVRLRALQDRLDRLSADERATVTIALAALEDLTSGPNSD